MRAWKVFSFEGKPLQLEIELNRVQKLGFTIYTIMPKSFGFLIIAFMDPPAAV
jgi:hypothetical protein